MPVKKAPAKKKPTAKAPAKKVVAKKPAPRKAAASATPTMPTAVKAPKRVKVLPEPKVWLHWCTGADFDRMLSFYMDELMLTPTYIAHPDLRAGIINEPQVWRERLLSTAITTLQEGFSPKRNTQSALLLRERGAGEAPEILAMFRVEVSPQRRATLLDLLVAKRHRMRGYGKMLFQGVLDQLQRLGVVEMNLSTSYENEDSKGFFRKLGLRPYAVFWAMDIAPAPPQETKLVSRQEVGGFGGKAED